jgi:hypothetical protein
MSAGGAGKSGRHPSLVDIFEGPEQIQQLVISRAIRRMRIE